MHQCKLADGERHHCRRLASARDHDVAQLARKLQSCRPKPPIERVASAIARNSNRHSQALTRRHREYHHRPKMTKRIKARSRKHVSGDRKRHAAEPAQQNLAPHNVTHSAASGLSAWLAGSRSLRVKSKLAGDLTTYKAEADRMVSWHGGRAALDMGIEIWASAASSGEITRSGL